MGDSLPLVRHAASLNHIHVARPDYSWRNEIRWVSAVACLASPLPSHITPESMPTPWRLLQLQYSLNYRKYMNKSHMAWRARLDAVTRVFPKRSVITASSWLATCCWKLFVEAFDSSTCYCVLDELSFRHVRIVLVTSHDGRFITRYFQIWSKEISHSSQRGVRHHVTVESSTRKRLPTFTLTRWGRIPFPVESKPFGIVPSRGVPFLYLYKPYFTLESSCFWCHNV